MTEKPPQVIAPPSDLDAESSVLSAIMFEQGLLAQVSFLRSEHFYADANRRIYEAIRALDSEGKPVDTVMVSGWLRDRELLAGIGGTPYLLQIIDTTPAAVHVEAHAKRIVNTYELRQIIIACQRIATESMGDVGDLDSWKRTVDSRIAAVTGSESQQKNLVLMEEATREAMRVLHERQQSKHKVNGFTTGLPTLDQRIGGFERTKKYVVAARPGMGKAQPLSARVLTPDGWKTMGDLKPGDFVIGANGRAVRVARVFERGELPVFRVTMSDGGSTLCCDDHLWRTRTRADRRSGGAGTVKTLREIRATMTRVDGGLNHSIPYVKPVHFTKQGDLPIHPYVLGVYLGDGHGVCISNPEPSVQRRFMERLPESDKAVVVGDAGIVVRISRRIRTKEKSNYHKALLELGLDDRRAEQKFIPEQFLTATVEDRIELLRGLCDTDGYVANPKNIEYTTVSQRLAEDIMRLVKELGGRISCNVKNTTYQYLGQKLRGQTAYRMVFGFPDGGIVPVSSEKHLAKWDASAMRTPIRYIKSVIPEGTAVCRCIEIESDDHLYVTDDCIVTHNSAAMATFVLSAAREVREGVHTCGVVCVSVEMPCIEITNRLLSQLSRVDSVKIQRGRLDAEELKRVHEASQILAKLPIAIEDSSNHTPASIRAAYRNGKRKLLERFAASGNKDNVAAREAGMPFYGALAEVGLLAIDYLQLLGTEDKPVNREAEVSAVCRATKAIAKSENIAVLELAQVNRDCEKRPGNDKRPQLADLRESGAIEQDANCVMFLYRDDVYKKDGDEKDDRAEIIVRKLRDNGGPGTVHCEFHPSTMTFYEKSRDPDYSQLGDMFDPYIDGSYGESSGGSSLPDWTPYDDDH